VLKTARAKDHFFTDLHHMIFRSPAQQVRMLLAVAEAALLLMCPGCRGSRPEVCIFTAAGKQVRVCVEIARTPAQRGLGLMYRNSLSKNSGMLFVSDRDMHQNFTMRNTSLPLDMIFVGSDFRIAGIIENASPLTDGPYAIARPSRYVLEVNSGFCKQHGIAQGDTVSFVNVTE